MKKIGSFFVKISLGFFLILLCGFSFRVLTANAFSLKSDGVQAMIGNEEKLDAILEQFKAVQSAADALWDYPFFGNRLSNILGIEKAKFSQSLNIISSEVSGNAKQNAGKAKNSAAVGSDTSFTNFAGKEMTALRAAQKATNNFSNLINDIKNKLLAAQGLREVDAQTAGFVDELRALGLVGEGITNSLDLLSKLEEEFNKLVNFLVEKILDLRRLQQAHQASLQEKKVAPTPAGGNVQKSYGATIKNNLPTVASGAFFIGGVIPSKIAGSERVVVTKSGVDGIYFSVRNLAPGATARLVFTGVSTGGKPSIVYLGSDEEYAPPVGVAEPQKGTGVFEPQNLLTGVKQTDTSLQAAPVGRVPRNLTPGGAGSTGGARF